MWLKNSIGRLYSYGEHGWRAIKNLALPNYSTNNLVLFIYYFTKGWFKHKGLCHLYTNFCHCYWHSSMCQKSNHCLEKLLSKSMYRILPTDMNIKLGVKLSGRVAWFKHKELCHLHPKFCHLCRHLPMRQKSGHCLKIELSKSMYIILPTHMDVELGIHVAWFK